MTRPSKQTCQDSTCTPAGKGAEREQRENRKPGRAGVETLLDAGEQQQVHDHDEGDPMQCLGRDQAEFLRLVVGVFPPGADANQRDQWRENLPIPGDRRF